MPKAKKMKSIPVSVGEFPKDPLHDRNVSRDEQKKEYGHLGMKFKESNPSAEEKRQSLDSVDASRFNSRSPQQPVETNPSEETTFDRQAGSAAGRRIDHMDSESYW